MGVRVMVKFLFSGVPARSASFQRPEHCLRDIGADAALNLHAVGTGFDDVGKRLIRSDDGRGHFLANTWDGR